MIKLIKRYYNFNLKSDGVAQLRPANHTLVKEQFARGNSSKRYVGLRLINTSISN